MPDFVFFGHVSVDAPTQAKDVLNAGRGGLGCSLVPSGKFIFRLLFAAFGFAKYFRKSQLKSVPGIYLFFVIIKPLECGILQEENHIRELESIVPPVM